MKKSLLFLALACSIALLGASFAQNNQQVRITNGPVVEGTGDTWAVVAWTTNTGSSAVVHYGTDQNNLSQTAQQDYSKGDAQNGANHRVRMTNLQPGMTYYFKVDSGEGQGTGTTASSNLAQFTTKQSGQSAGQSTTPAGSQNLQIIDGPRVFRAGDSWAVIGWKTNAGGGSIVHYGTDQNNLNQTAQSPYASGQDRAMHRVRITGLQPNTTYYFTVDSSEGQGTGTSVKSNVAQFTTSPQGQR